MQSSFPKTRLQARNVLAARAGTAASSRTQDKCAFHALLPPSIANLTKDVAKGAAVLAATALVAGPSGAITMDELQRLSYKDVKGSGIAALCPTIEMPQDVKSLKPGSYEMVNFCIEPTKFEIREDGKNGPEWVPTKLLTRLTYTLSQMEGKVNIGNNGELHMKENEGGMDFNVLTVKVPRGEEYPLMFSAKNLDVKGSADSMVGEFTVPPYRGSSFMDPRGRGDTTGYDAFQGLQAAEGGDLDKWARQNRKWTHVDTGIAQFAIAQADPELGEIAGVFETISPVSDDMGSVANPTDVKVTGIWYAQIQ